MLYMVKVTFEGESLEAEIFGRFLFNLSTQTHNATFSRRKKLSNGIFKSTFKLPLGTSQVMYKDKLIQVNRTISNIQYNGTPVEEFSISGDFDYHFISDMIEESRKFNELKDTKDLNSYILKSGGWYKLCEITRRSPDTIFLPGSIKSDILNDIDTFIGSQKDYMKFGIPYKRNYLITGPPGSGKTSSIVMLASHINYDIANISAGNGITDNEFARVINSLPSKTLLVLEDIDSIFENKKGSEIGCRLTFSGLTCCLDGLTKKDSLITILTTNNIEKLDKVLLRDGRMDYIAQLGKVTKNQVIGALSFYFPEDDNIEQFYDKINTFEFSMSSLQKFCFTHRDKKLYRNIIKNL